MWVTVHQTLRPDPSRVQDGKGEGTNRHDVAGEVRKYRFAKAHWPTNKAMIKKDGHRGVEQAQFSKIQKAAADARHFTCNGASSGNASDRSRKMTTPAHGATTSTIPIKRRRSVANS